jgi:hypothetical protein
MLKKRSLQITKIPWEKYRNAIQSRVFSTGDETPMPATCDLLPGTKPLGHREVSSAGRDLLQGLQQGGCRSAGKGSG